MEKRKRTGIMGGTFDPVHYGHLLIAENAAEQYQLDEVIFMPTGHSPHKGRQNIIAAHHRCEMIHLAIADNPLFSLSMQEIQSKEVNYTFHTLESFLTSHPNEELFFIMGGDSLKDFRSWRHPKRILKSASLLAAVRDDIDGYEFQRQMDELNEWYGTQRIFRLNTPNFSISSRYIRTLASAGKTIRYMLPDGVRRYILEHQLYAEKKQDEENETT